MPRAEFDLSELERWSEVVGQAPARVRLGGRAVVSRGSLQIKNDARQNAPGSGAARHYPKSIGYDITERPGQIEGEIGPVRGRRQWGLGNLLEYGSENNPPHPHLEPALDREAPKFLAACQALAGGVFDGGLRLGPR